MVRQIHGEVREMDERWGGIVTWSDDDLLEGTDAGAGPVPTGELGSVSETPAPTPEWAATNYEATILRQVMDWAGEDPKQWARILKALKRSWVPEGWTSEGPRDILVAWASAHQRLAKAARAHSRLPPQKMEKHRNAVIRIAREADLGFFGRVIVGLFPRAAQALKSDWEAATILAGLTAKEVGGDGY